MSTARWPHYDRKKLNAGSPQSLQAGGEARLEFAVISPD
jgi:hypothetical protein